MDTIDNMRLYDFESKIGTKVLKIHIRWRPAELPTKLTEVGIETQCACRSVGADSLSKRVIQAALLLSSVLLTAVHDVNQTKSECL